MRKHPYTVLALAFLLAPLLYMLAMGVVLGLARFLALRSPVPELVLFLLRSLFILAMAALSLLAIRRVAGDMFPPRAAKWTVRAAALAFAAFFIHGFASGDALGFTFFCAGQTASVSCTGAFCTALFGLAALLRQRGRRAVPLVLRVVTGLLVVCVLAALADEWLASSPFRAACRSGTVGDPPREAVLSSSWFGWNLGCDVRLYVRRPSDGRWDAWLFDGWPHPVRNASVELFPDGRPAIYPDRAEPFMLFGQRPSADAPRVPWKPPSGDPGYPADLAPADLHAIHRTLCKKPYFGFLPRTIPEPDVVIPDKSDPTDWILLGAGSETRAAPSARP